MSNGSTAGGSAWIVRMSSLRNSRPPPTLPVPSNLRARGKTLNGHPISGNHHFVSRINGAFWGNALGGTDTNRFREIH
jgi:hypothetical protein